MSAEKTGARPYTKTSARWSVGWRRGHLSEAEEKEKAAEISSARARVVAARKAERERDYPATAVYWKQVELGTEEKGGS